MTRKVEAVRVPQVPPWLQVARRIRGGMFSKRILTKRSSPFAILLTLTLLSFVTQVVFFILHGQSAELIDDLVGSAMASHFFHWAVLAPLIKFSFFQFLAYALFIGFIGFLAKALRGFLGLTSYTLAFILWFLATASMLCLNEYCYPDSFLANLIPDPTLNSFLTVVFCTFMLAVTVFAYYRVFKQKTERLPATIFLLFALLLGLSSWTGLEKPLTELKSQRPNIIIIGLDSLRPDYTSYYGHSGLQTPEIDAFLASSLHFKEAYTPLARTYPAWISILTGQYPKHSQARANLNDPLPVIAQDNLAKRLREAGYETLYATDEKRFSNITKAYGFDRILGPSMGLSDFILGGLSDLPLTNLLVNLPFGRFIFPYNYANRAAAITYQPDKFMDLLSRGIGYQHSKPVFIAVHFCITHWPFTWANDQQGKNFRLDQRYAASVTKVDQQLGLLLTLLKQRGYLEHSIVVLLSDHGTTLGLPGDRIINKAHYQGEATKLNWLTVNRYNSGPASSIDLNRDYGLDTSYGQGSDILSLKQYQILLALKGYGLNLAVKEAKIRSSLLDLAPTILSLLELPPLKKAEGSSLLSLHERQTRPFFMETGYSIAGLETDKISVEKVVKNSIDLYTLDPKTGFLYVTTKGEKAVLKAKQRSVLYGDWLLARYPKSHREGFVSMKGNKSKMLPKTYHIPAYYVLANLKTGQWTVGFDSALAKQAPLAELRSLFEDFYGDEI